MTEAVAIILLISARTLRAAQKAFISLPSRELRRRGAKDDNEAHRLYLAARYESRLQLLLEVLIVLLVSGLAYVIFSELDRSWAIAINAGLILYFFVIAPSTKARSTGRKLALVLSPYLAWTMRYASPVLHIIQPDDFAKPRNQNLYNNQELVDFLEAQKNVEGSQIDRDDIERSIHAFKNKNLQVKDVMVAKKSMKILRESEEIGPILLSELHGSGQESFAVQDKEGDISGLVSLEKLTAHKAGGKVSKAMDRRLVYVKDDWPIAKAATAFKETARTDFLVINSKQKIIGVVSFPRLLSALIGEHKSRKFYDSLDVADS